MPTSHKADARSLAQLLKHGFHGFTEGNCHLFGKTPQMGLSVKVTTYAVT
jgi:hypothetical protein